MVENLKRAELARLATLFRQFAAQTDHPEYRTKFLRAADEFERVMNAAGDDGADRKPR